MFWFFRVRTFFWLKSSLFIVSLTMVTVVEIFFTACPNQNLPHEKLVVGTLTESLATRGTIPSSSLITCISLFCLPVLWLVSTLQVRSVHMASSPSNTLPNVQLLIKSHPIIFLLFQFHYFPISPKVLKVWDEGDNIPPAE